MTDVLIVIVTALVVIAAAALVGPRLGIAAPLVLVAVGVAVSFLPMFAAVHIEPELILEGVLPPLLYSSAVSMPSMNFRREFGAISGLSVLLVVGTSLLLGVFFMLVLPGLGFAWGVAIGAVISPTDAVATSIIKQASVSKRVVAMLDGESLLNDATALVILRTATFTVASAFSFWGAVGNFAYSVAVAVLIGWAVGSIDLVVRRRVTDPTVNTVISFAVPFVASVPAELLGASGLVAAVVAGLLAGIFAPRYFSPQNRLSDSQNWRTVTLVLEGAVFLTMGVQIRSIVLNVEQDHARAGTAVLIALAALALTVLIRAAYVTPLLAVLKLWSRRGEQLKGQLQDMQDGMSSPEGKQKAFDQVNSRRRPPTDRDIERFAGRVTKVLANIDYLRREPLGWREGVVVVWAGMRGAVTVAAAQSLPERTPQRSELVLIAFTVAALSLLAQGGTIGPLIRRLQPTVDEAAIEQTDAERMRIIELMRSAADTVPEPPRAQGGEPRREQFDSAKASQLAVLRAQRSALLNARDNGTFDADVLANALANLDASQIALEMRGQPTGAG